MPKTFRFGMSFATIIGFISYYFVVISTNQFEPSYALPFHLCPLMQLFTLYALMKDKRNWIEAIVYPLIIGPTLALLFPVGTFHLGGFFTYYFVYYHVLLILTGCIVLWWMRFSTTRKHIISGAFFIFVCDLIALPINFLTNGNYMFIGAPIILPPLAYYLTLFVFVWVFLIVFHLLVKGARGTRNYVKAHLNV